jgi:hypothetical protein
MRKPSHSSPAARRVCLFVFVALSFLAACGKKQHAAVLREAPPKPVNPHSVTISWTASKSTVHGYNVYRASPPAAAVKITNGIVLGTEYTDHEAQAGQTYTYFVTSVDFKGVESKPSPKVTATVPTTVALPANPPAKQ